MIKKRKRLKKRRPRKPDLSLAQVSTDVRYVGEYPKGYKSLLDYLNKTGKVQLTSLVQLQTAKRYYVVKLYAPSQIAKALSLPVDLIYRWKNVWDWDSDREHHERMLYWRATKSLKQVQPDLDLTHDRLAVKMESVIERLIDETMQQETPDVKDLRNLASALQSIINLRRTIGGKATQKTEHAHAHAHAHGIVNDEHKMQALTDLVEKHLATPTETIALGLDENEITDAEYEEIPA